MPDPTTQAAFRRERRRRQLDAYRALMGAEATRRQIEFRAAHPSWEQEVGILVEGPPPEPSPTRQPKMHKAYVLLRAELAQGERPALEVIAAAEAAGISLRTLKSAKAALGVDDTRHAFGGAVFWKPPRRVEVRWVPAKRWKALVAYEKDRALAERRRAAAPPAPCRAPR